jgi:GntR family transcriptional regulator, transcriptional repressor for pyruvate dehydrogenase complex
MIYQHTKDGNTIRDEALVVSQVTEYSMQQSLVPHLERRNLADQVALILKRHILSERLEPGDRLPSERRLADWANVSRVVLREALSRLIGEGILYRPSPRMLAVADFDRARIAAELSILDEDVTETQDLSELRVILELGSIDAIVDRMTEERLAIIEHWVLEGERRLERSEPIYPADAGFHTELLKSLGNSAIDGFLPLIEENFRRDLVHDRHLLSGAAAVNDPESIEQHRQIYEAIKRRDHAQTRYWMYEHLSPYLDRDYKRS